jgi:hypothetical protein
MRLIVDGDGLQRSAVVRSSGEMISTRETWQAAMIEQGWR